jgi:ferric-dicitrate binding protein FerR (iron transport regulator)
MNERAAPPGQQSDELVVLFEHVATRERPSGAAEAAAFTALHSEWRRNTLARRRRRVASFAAAAAASLAVAAVGYLVLTRPTATIETALATIEQVEGDDVTWRDDRSQAQALGGRRVLEGGQRLATGPASRVALRWHDGGSLRLDAESRVEFVSKGALRLSAGRLYFDSAVEVTGRPAPILAVQTPAGEVVHIGTQFMISVAGEEVVLSVREGQVKVTGDGFELVVAANQELDLRPDGTRRTSPIDGYGPAWEWATDIAPPIELDGRSAFDVVAWAARETGRRVVYETQIAEMRARDNVLRGVDRREPDGILALLPHLTDLAYEVRGEAIVVSVP